MTEIRRDPTNATKERVPKTRVYIYPDPAASFESNLFGLTDALEEIDIGFSYDQPFTNGTWRIEADESQMPTVRDLVQEYGFWIFLENGGNSVEVDHSIGQQE